MPETPVTFLSHNSADKPAVAEIMRRLASCDPPLPCWIDKDDLRAGGTWMSQIESILATCGSAALFFGPAGQGPIHDLERQKLIDRAARERESFWLVPVLLPGVEPAAVDGFATLFNWVDFRDGLDSPAALERLHKLLRGEAPRTVSAEDELAGEPYRGLEHFDAPHAELFFGRDEEIRKLCGLLEKLPFVAIVGASGSGKSSLARAGLQTQLARTTLPRLAQATTITLVPGDNPLRALADQLATALIPESRRDERLGRANEFERHLQSHRDGLRTLLASLFGQPDCVLLIVDQFEEVFTWNRHRREPSASAPSGRQQTEWFLSLLSDLVTAGDRRFRVVITLRSDFLSRCLEYSSLRLLLEHERNPQVLLGELSPASLREIVVSPATQFGAYFEKGLVQRILQDFADQSGSLPLLAHALKELWAQRRGRWLTNEGYDATGGVARALCQRANATFDSLTGEQRDIAKHIFLRLVTLGEGVSDTRRRVQLQELYPVDPAKRAEVTKVIDELRHKDSRLIVTHHDGTVQVTHEALLQHWDKLKRWLEDHRDDKRLHDRLHDAAKDWLATHPDAPGKRDASYLWEGGRLEDAEQFGREHGGVLNELESNFLQASIAKRDFKTRIRRSLAVAAVLVVVAVFGLAMWAFQKRSEAEQATIAANRNLADANWTLAFTERDHLADPYAAAWHFQRAAEASDLGRLPGSRKSALLAIQGLAVPKSSFPHQVGSGVTAQFSQDETRVLTWSSDGTVRLWDVANARVLCTWKHDKSNFGVIGARFNRDESRVLTWSDDGTARLWSAVQDTPLRTWKHDTSVNGAQFSRDESRVLTWSGDGTARLWSAGQDTPLRTWKHDKSVYGARFSRDESRALTWSEDGTARLWYAGQDSPLRTWKHDYSVEGAQFSRDESRVLTWSGDGTARLWSAGQDAAIQDTPLRTWKHDKSVNGAQFSRDESRVLTWSDDGTARLWDTCQEVPLRTWKHDGSVYGAQFSRDESRVLTWTHDGTARLWDTWQDTPLRTWKHDGLVNGAQFNRDEARVLTWSEDGTARLWETVQDTPLHTWKHDRNQFGRDAVLGAQFSRNESRVLTWSIDGTARLWDTWQDTPVHTWKHGKSVNGAQFNRDESRVLTWSDDGTARLWAQDTPVRTWRHDTNRFGGGSVLGARFNRNSSRVLTRSSDCTARLWDTDQDTPLRIWKHDRQVNGAQFSQDESRVLTWSDDDTARLWDKDQDSPLRVWKHDKSVFGAQFNQDESRVLTWSDDGTARLWNKDQNTPLRVWKHDKSVFGAQFSQDESRVLTWSDDGTARLWDKDQDTPLRVWKHDKSVFGAQFNLDESRVLTWSGDGTARLWDTWQDTPLRTWKHDKSVHGVRRAQFSRDESRVLTWSDDGTVRIWDAGHDTPLRAWKPDSSFLGVQFSRDESRVLTWSSDGTARLWDAGQDTPLRTWKHDGLVRGAQFDRDESRVLTWGDDGTARLWDLSLDETIPLSERRLELEVRTGTTLDDSGHVQRLSFEQWERKRQQLDQLRARRRK